MPVRAPLRRSCPEWSAPSLDHPISLTRPAGGTSRNTRSTDISRAPSLQRPKGRASCPPFFALSRFTLPPSIHEQPLRRRFRPLTFTTRRLLSYAREGRRACVHTVRDENARHRVLRDSRSPLVQGTAPHPEGVAVGSSRGIHEQCALSHACDKHTSNGLSAFTLCDPELSDIHAPHMYASCHMHACMCVQCALVFPARRPRRPREARSKLDVLQSRRCGGLTAAR